MITLSLHIASFYIHPLNNSCELTLSTVQHVYVRVCICECRNLLRGEVQSAALAVVGLVDRGAGLQQNLCTVQSVSQHAVHQRGPAKLVLTVPQRRICHTHTHTHTHSTV